MIAIYLIQACLFILGVIPFLCEISRHFYDSFLTIIARTVVFIITLICGWYAPHLQQLPDILLALVTVVLSYYSYTTIRDVSIIYYRKLKKQ